VTHKRFIFCLTIAAACYFSQAGHFWQGIAICALGAFFEMLLEQ